MSKVVLLPDWASAPTWKEIIGKVKEPDDELPEPWQPRLEEAETIEQTEAIAFPTPFAWSEMMAAVIRQNKFDHLLFKYYGDLFVGLVLGHLQLEIADMKSFELGKVLASTDDRYRYFGLLRATSRQPEVQGKVFGATSPESLLWPSPRRTEVEWRKLRELIQTDSHLNVGNQMLADLREVMRRQRLWQPNEVPWMKGLDRIIRDLKASEGEKLIQLHSRTVGPTLAMIGGGRMRPLYLPVYEEGFGAELSRALTGAFKKKEGAIVILDDKNREQYEIRMPPVPADGDLLLAGGGTIRVFDKTGRISEFTTGRLRLEDDTRGDGLYTLLQPLDEAMRRDQKLYPAVGRAQDDIRQQPYFYPDVIRIPATRVPQAATSGDEISYSAQAYQLVFDAESFGLPALNELVNPADSGTRSFVLDHSQGGRNKRQIFLERYKGREVNDLTTLGWVLWSFFIGQVTWQNDRFRDEELTPVMTLGSGVRLFEMTDQAYHKATKNREQYRRLATLQRFLRNYADRAKAAGGSTIASLCLEASRAFIEAVWPDQRVIENGYPSAQWQIIDPDGLRLELARDIREKR
jgi:hypothetical protein